MLSISVCFVQAQKISIGLQSFDTAFNNKIIQEKFVPIDASTIRIQFGKSTWEVKDSVYNQSVTDGKADHLIRFRCISGETENTNASVRFEFEKWKESNYVLMPSAVYNGNRFPSRRLRYSPKLHDIKDIGIDKPMIISDVPRLSLTGYVSKIQERSGSMSTPSVGIYDAVEKRYFWMITDQGNKWGDHGINIAESNDRTKMMLSIESPVVRETYAYTMCDNQKASWDKARNFKKGDTILIRVRTYQKNGERLQALFDKFFEIRNDFSTPPVIQRKIPLSECFRVIEEKFNQQNYVANHGYYSVGMRENFLQDWQIGWTGGMISTLPLLSEGNSTSQANAANNFKWLFEKGISPSGFFWDAGSNGTNWYGGDIRNVHTKNWHLVRKSGDAVWYILKQFEIMRSKNIPIDPNWEKGLKTVCNSFVNLWQKNHQLGQFIDSENGSIIVGGSSSGAIVPAGLAKACTYFNDSAYLKIAEEIGEYFYLNFTSKGISCGGPGDALQNPDSESGEALLESYIALYESTKQKKWLIRAEEAAKQFATWVVSYDYVFPDTSAFRKMNISSRGSVYANTQNKHAAPGICTASGNGLLKLYQYTDDIRYLLLLKEITNSISQFVSHPALQFGKAPFGWVTERINLTDWEGEGSIGYVLPISTWAETSVMLTYAELPGVIIDLDKKVYETLDHVALEKIKEDERFISFSLSNPTAFPAHVKMDVYNKMKGNKQMKVLLKAKEKQIVEIEK